MSNNISFVPSFVPKTTKKATKKPSSIFNTSFSPIKILDKGFVASSTQYHKGTDYEKYCLYNTTQNLFITGKAGTGKSTMLKEFVAYCKQNNINCVVVAPTGIASINVNGTTIHSFFQIDIHNPTNLKKLNPIKKNILKAVDVLVIDEMSMVSDQMFDLINRRMNQAKFGDNPHSKKFGGARLLLFGDIFQLGPINKEDEKQVGYFFESMIFEFMRYNGNIALLELNKIWRQDDQKFIDILSKIRDNSAKNSDLELLNRKILLEPADTFAKKNNFSILCTTNRQVNYYNTQILNTIDSKTHVFTGKLLGEFAHYDGLPAMELELKIGCLVVFVKNDASKRWINGDFGIINNFVYRLTLVKNEQQTIETYADYLNEKDKIKADMEKFAKDGYKISNAGYYLQITLTRTGEEVFVGKDNWEKKQYEMVEEEVIVDGEKMIRQSIKDKIVGAYNQFPLKVGYALTVHKSQGMTLEGAVLDFGSGTFGSGLAYVAFSRVKSLANLYLTAPIDTTIVKLDPKVVEFYNDWKSDEVMI